jgi:protein-S-isoprenylcysteine O-methyltransferase Ste14
MIGLHLLLPWRRIVVFPLNTLGAVPIAVGVGANLWADRQFKRARTTVKPFEMPNTLVTAGAFSFSRHPMYTGMAMLLIGLAVFLGSVAPWLGVAGFVMVISWRFIPAEEKAMEEAFGEAYREYSKTVRRWV